MPYLSMFGRTWAFDETSRSSITLNEGNLFENIGKTFLESLVVCRPTLLLYWLRRQTFDFRIRLCILKQLQIISSPTQ